MEKLLPGAYLLEYYACIWPERLSTVCRFILFSTMYVIQQYCTEDQRWLGSWVYSANQFAVPLNTTTPLLKSTLQKLSAASGVKNSPVYNKSERVGTGASVKQLYKYSVYRMARGVFRLELLYNRSKLSSINRRGSSHRISLKPHLLVFTKHSKPRFKCKHYHAPANKQTYKRVESPLRSVHLSNLLWTGMVALWHRQPSSDVALKSNHVRPQTLKSHPLILPSPR